MAKTLTIFAKEVFDLKPNVNANCSFNDLASQSEEMK
jgi:hypothetical protein